MTLESSLQRDVLKYLENLDRCECHKNVVSNKAGVPDITACYRGRYVAFELKRPGRKHERRGGASPQQFEIMRRIRVAEGYSFLVESLDDVKRAIVAIDCAVETLERRSCEHGEKHCQSTDNQGP